jgi:hypothetical protein
MRSSTPGSILLSNASNDYQHTVPGSNGAVLTVVAGVPTWQAISFPSEYDQYANKAARPATGLVDVIYYSTAEGVFSIWNGTAYVDVPSSSTFSVAGNSGTAQSIVGGDTLSILASRGFTTVASATDTITVTPPAGATTGQVLTWNNTTSVWEAGTAVPTFQRDNFTATASQTVFTAALTPIAGSVTVYRNGLLDNLTTDYTISGSAVTLLTSALAGETISLLYRV